MFGIIAAGVAAAAAASTAGYASMAPKNQLFGRTFLGLGAGSRKLALTYDDGPNDRDTEALLEVLDRHHAKATFFMIGAHVRKRPQIAQAVARAGHAVGNHTFAHPNLIFTPASKVTTELQECEAALIDAIGEHAPLFRPPFGGRRPEVLRLARAAGLTPVMWSITCYDWKENSPRWIEWHVERQLRGGDVILLHDGGHTAVGADRRHTVEATDRILRRWKEEGYEFVTVSEMMKESGFGSQRKHAEP